MPYRPTEWKLHFAGIARSNDIPTQYNRDLYVPDNYDSENFIE